MNRYIAGMAAAVVYSVLLFWFADNHGYDRRDLEANKQANSQWEMYQAQIAKRDAEYQAKLSKLSKSESQAWEKYQDAQANYDNAVSDANSWRVRVNSCNTTANSVSDNSTSTRVGDEQADGLTQLPDAVARSLAAVGQRADQCEAKLEALQKWAELVK